MSTKRLAEAAINWRSAVCGDPDRIIVVAVPVGFQKTTYGGGRAMLAVAALTPDGWEFPKDPFPVVPMMLSRFMDRSCIRNKTERVHLSTIAD